MNAPAVAPCVPTARLDPRWQHVRSSLGPTSDEINADEHADLVIEMIQKRGVDPFQLGQ